LVSDDESAVFSCEAQYLEATVLLRVTMNSDQEYEMNKPKPNVEDYEKLLDRIKAWAVQAMFSDDELLEELVLKGGNAMALVHKISARSSVDLDFSLKQDFGGDIAKIEARISRVLSETFRANGYEVFDFKMLEKPKAISDDMKHFWGGYGLEFKLASTDAFNQYSASLEELRKRAINLGQGQKFLIDISRFEYVGGKQRVDFDGYVIYVYSPEMIVCEKLRAICQQMPEYGPFIKRDRAGSARPKDFVDIFVLMDGLTLDLNNETVRQTLVSMFEIKNVPLEFLGKVSDTYEFHLAGFSSVKDTVASDFQLKAFDYYFKYTVALIDQLKPFWHK
jgi:Nucleotidyl transferase AbiEii toxin, Type IV TA system